MNLAELGQTGFSQTQAEVKAFESTMVKEYQTALNAIKKDIRKIYDKVIGDRSPVQLANLIKANPAFLFTEANKFGRLTALEKSIRDIYVKTSVMVANQTVEAGKLSMINNFFKQQYAVGFASDIPLSFAVINPAVVEQSVLGTTKIWDGLRKSTQEKISDKFGSAGAYLPKHGTLSSTLIKNRASDLAKLKSSINQGLLQGKGFAQTARDVKKVLNGSASQALRVVRTESMRNMNAGAYADHNQAVSQGLDMQREILSVLDDRTRPQSQTVDTRKENEDGFFVYPGGVLVSFPGNSGVPGFDINDRETVIEIIDGQEPELRRGRSPVTGKNELMSFKDYPTWMKDNGFSQNKTGRWVLK